MTEITVHHGDCREVLASLPDCSVDSVVTDPPYELGFMGKTWDASGVAYSVELWAEVLRVLKPGGHLVAFGGTRTYHRMAVAIEDAGFEIRDSLHWVYGSGFPKSLDVSKAIDKQRDDKADIYRVTAWVRQARDSANITNKDIDAAFGFAGMAGHWTSGKSQPAVPTLEQVPLLLDTLNVEMDDVPEDIRRLLWDLNGRKGQPGENWWKREVVGKADSTALAVAPGEGRDRPRVELDITAPATDAAKQWEGWGTALKPAHETVILARKGSNDTVDFSPVPILEVASWLLSSANDAMGSSTSSRAEYVEALFDSARKLAEQQPAIPADLLEGTAMWLCAWAIPTTLSIVSSWLASWDAISAAENTSTTSTASSTTTGLRTFRFLISQITPENTPMSVTKAGGESSPAWLAVQTLCDALLNLSDTLGLPAPASATSVWQELCRAEEGSPAHEPIVLARKPLIGTVAATVLEHGTGALNIDGCRVGSEVRTTSWSGTANYKVSDPKDGQTTVTGRWPANLVFTHAADCADDCVDGCPIATLDQQQDGASRFFTVTEWSEIDVPFQYVAKPSKRERNAGLEKLKAKTAGEATDRKEGSDGLNSPRAGAGRTGGSKNHHPTVKPLALMRWLVRLVTPPGGTVLEPFAGSGTTLMACVLEGFHGIGIEMTDEYLPIIDGRVQWAREEAQREAEAKVSETEQESLF